MDLDIQEYKPTILLLSGKKQSGKDTAGKLLQQYNYSCVAFGDELKNKCTILANSILELNISSNYFHDNKLKETDIYIPFLQKNVTPRYLLQTFGTAFIRNCIHEDYWSLFLVNEIKNKYKGKNIVITDVRFPNEIEIITHNLKDFYNIYTIRIIRNNSTIQNDLHISETALDCYSK